MWVTVLHGSEVCGREKYGPAVDVRSSGRGAVHSVDGSAALGAAAAVRLRPRPRRRERSRTDSSDAEQRSDFEDAPAVPGRSVHGPGSSFDQHSWFKREERNRLSSPRYAPQLKLFQEKRKRRRDSAALDLTPMNARCLTSTSGAAPSPTPSALGIRHAVVRRVGLRRRRAGPASAIPLATISPWTTTVEPAEAGFLLV